MKKFWCPLKTSLTPVKPTATMAPASTALRAGMPANTKAFSTCSIARRQLVIPAACWAAYDKAQPACSDENPQIAATAAVAAICGFSSEQAGWALSYAAQQAAGITSWRRAIEHVEKAFVFAGMPARNAVEAGAMVAVGFTGVNDVFSGHQNFFITFGQEANPDLLADGLGERYEITETTIKKWTVGSPAQSVLDGVQTLIERHQIDHEEITKISIQMAPIEIDTVDDRAMPDISLQHLVSLLLLDHELTFESSHNVARMQDQTVLALKRKISLVPDVTRERRRAFVTIHLRNGSAFSHKAGPVRGSPANPMSQSEIVEQETALH